MNLIFIRHGEATDNVKELISDKEIYWSILTERGKKAVLDSIQYLPNNISKMYVSPFPRTLETAHYIYEYNSDIEVIVDNRIREINYGKYSHQKNNEDLDNIRKKQIEGDNLVRFGDYGENKLEIETRLIEFLTDVYKENNESDNIVIVSHGSIISYMKRLLNIKSKHIEKGQLEIFNNVNLDIKK